MAKLTKRQKRAAAKAPNWVRTVAISKRYGPKRKRELDAADQFLAKHTRGESP